MIQSFFEKQGLQLAIVIILIIAIPILANITVRNESAIANLNSTVNYMNATVHDFIGDRNSISNKTEDKLNKIGNYTELSAGFIDLNNATKNRTTMAMENLTEQNIAQYNISAENNAILKQLMDYILVNQTVMFCNCSNQTS